MIAEYFYSQKKHWHFIFGIIIYSLISIAVSVILKIPVPADLDYSMLYSATVGLLNGVNIYDLTGQVRLLSKLLEISPANINLPAYVYPPWYAMFTFFLGFFPPDVSARVWFFLNLGMIVASVALISYEWPYINRLAAIFASILFLPSLGLLVVGQFTAPVLLGASIFIFSNRKSNLWLASLAIFLMTFKPQIGLLMIAFGIIGLIGKSVTNAKKVILHSLLIFMIVFGISFIVDPSWPTKYFYSLIKFKELTTFSICEICSSLSILIVGLFSGASSTSIASWVGSLGLIVFFLGVIRYILKRKGNISIEYIIGGTIIALMISLPYLNNYDYLLLLLPFLIIASKYRLQFLFISSAIMIFTPWAAMVLFGRQGVAWTLAFLPIILIIFWGYQTLSKQDK